MIKNILSLAFLLMLSVAVKAQYNPTAEVFIEVSDEGRYTLTLDDQSITSNRSRFRFFEVSAGNAIMRISIDKQPLLNTNIRLDAGDRYVFSYSKRLGLKLISQMPCYSNGAYVLDNWDGSLKPLPDNNPGFPRRRTIRAMGSTQFNSFLQTIKREYFDDSRYTAFAAAIKDNALTVDQLKQVLKLYSFDDGKLKTAFLAYDYVTDPQRFFEIKDSVSFLSSRESIDKFLLKK